MEEVFHMVPAPPRSLIILVLIALVLLPVLLLLGYSGYSGRNTRFELRPEGLAITGTMYGRVIPWADLRIDQAAAVNLDEHPELRPTLRTNGLGLPGHRAGWFRIRGGRGLFFVTDSQRVVTIPTTEGYRVLMSVEEPERFLRALRDAAELAG